MAKTEVARVVEEKREMARNERSANLWQNAFIVRSCWLFWLFCSESWCRHLNVDCSRKGVSVLLKLGRRVRHVTRILSYLSLVVLQT